MKRMVFAFLAAGAAIATLATPAMADKPEALPVPDPITCQLSDVSGAIDCVGYYGSNIFSNSGADQGTQSAALAELGFVGTPDYSNIYDPGSGLKLSSLNGASSISFSGAPTLFGVTYVGVHWGNQSAVYKLLLSSPVTSLTIKGDNPGGSSNAVLYATQPYTPAVPEPASWAMLIGGMSLVGVAMRRRTVNVSFA